MEVVYLGTNLQWRGRLGSVNALEAQRDAEAVMDAWENEEFYERKKAEIAALFTEKKTINAEAMKFIWNQLARPENKEVWYPIAVAVLEKYARGITTDLWSTQQKLNFIYYIL